MTFYPKELIKRIFFLLPRLLLVSVIVVYATFAFLTYFDYFEPYIFPLHLIKGKAHQLNENIIIGPYPHPEDMKRLKKDHDVTIVISLLNTDLPQEKALYNKEREHAERLGMAVYSFPLEFVSLKSKSNRTTAKKLADFIKRHPHNKVYIHCYLGKHRINFVKRELLREGVLKNQNIKQQ